MKNIMLILLSLALPALALGQEPPASPKPLEDLNIEFMLRGYFYAGSTIKDKNALGGFGKSENLPKAIDPSMSVALGAVSLVALPEEETVFAEKHKGIKVLLVNATNNQVGFPASDSRLSILQEALDRDGKWKPIEYLPSSWCGNSYHTVFLDANEYWEFAAARVTGEFKTKLRFRLDMRKSKTPQAPIYSNEFDGSVNTKQFAVQQGHKPTSIMDPYNN